MQELPQTLNVNSSSSSSASAPRERDRIWQVSPDLLGIVSTRTASLAEREPRLDVTLGWPASDFIGRTAQWIAHPDEEDKLCTELRH